MAKFKETTVFYTDKGKGNCVVLLHGFLENITMWNDVVTEVSKRNRVVCIDLLGHGKTACVGYIHSMEEMADAVKAVLKELRIRKAIFIGHSMGGYVSLAFAEKYPENVKALCLLNSTTQEDSEERKELRLRASKMAQTNYEALVKMSITNLFAEASREQFSKEIETIKTEALKTPVQGYIAATKGMRLRENKETIFQTIEKRLIISGIDDPLLEEQSIKEEGVRTNTPVVFLPHGHMSHIEAKTELIKELANFIKA
ncbi:alpha/beta fold hydrolase [Tenacibaculum crassostreae]|uniref:alpha/beta fold hydrolase n=1 Tax=Tenacibaculum crassostreae TaxID=502683 RepID=UPI003894D63A